MNKFELIRLKSAIRFGRMISLKVKHQFGADDFFDVMHGFTEEEYNA